MSELTFEALMELVNRIDKNLIGDEDYTYRNEKELVRFFEGYAPVLSIGCGEGGFLKALAENKIPAKGIDGLESNIALCKDKEYDVELVEDLTAYLSDNAKNYFGATLFNAIELLDGLGAVTLLSQIYDAMPYGSVFVLTTASNEFNRQLYTATEVVRPYTREWLESAFKEIGFFTIDVGTLSRGDIYIVGVKNQ